MRVMLVTGGTGSIGSVIAAHAVAAGWSVVVHGRSNASVTEAVARLCQSGAERRIAGVAVDIHEPEAWTRLIDQAALCFGRIDAVVDCAVTGPDEGRVIGTFAQTSPAAYAAFAELSIVALQRLTYAALPWLQQSQGCLVSLVSDAALFAAPGQALIGAARAAVVGFVRNLAMEVARDGVRVHCVSATFVDATRTARRLEQADSTRLERARQRAGLGLPTPADIAPAVLFLCGDGARRMTGQILSINGGLNA